MTAMFLAKLSIIIPANTVNCCIIGMSLASILRHNYTMVVTARYIEYISVF